MQRASTLAMLAGLAALAAALAAPGAALDPACQALGGSRLLQDDASSGRDAGDAPPGAVPILEEQYVWGYLDNTITTVSTGAEDLDDWFTAAAPPGPRQVSFGIVSQPWYKAGVPVEVLQLLYPPLPLFQLDAFAPGSSIALHTNSAAGGNITLFADDPGTWLFHAYVLPYAAEAVCAPPPATGSLSLLPEEAQDYGVYFGCDPVCLPGPGMGNDR